jgi:regulator of replication initiation timing
MLEASLSQLEQLVNDLVQQNQELLGSNEALKAELARAKDENDSLQLNLMEQEERTAPPPRASRRWLSVSAQGLSAHE